MTRGRVFVSWLAGRVGVNRVSLRSQIAAPCPGLISGGYAGLGRVSRYEPVCNRNIAAAGRSQHGTLHVSGPCVSGPTARKAYNRIPDLEPSPGPGISRWSRRGAVERPKTSSGIGQTEDYLAVGAAERG